MLSNLFRAALVAASFALLPGCGGGGGGSTSRSMTPPVTPPVPGPSSAPATAVLSTQTLNGAVAFVASSGKTVYVFDADLATPGQSSCTGACAAVWPAVTPPSGVTIAAPWSTFARPDGTTQLVYNTRPLYTYVADSGPGSVAGDGITSFGGLWHISRPQGSSTGTSPNPPTGGNPY